MPNSRCFLIGHRDTSSDILPSLTTKIEHHIREQGITEFVVGQYGGFDRLAVEQSEYLIAGLRHPGSCTASLVRYALGRQRQGKLTVTLLPLPDGSPCPLPR